MSSADDITRRPLERMALILFPSEAVAQDFKCAVAVFGGNIVADIDYELGAAALGDDPCELITISDTAVANMLDAADRAD